MKRRSVAALPMLVCAAALAACAHGSGTSGQAQPAASRKQSMPVQTAVVKMETVPIVASGYGSVSGGANAQASLAFAEAGRIAHVEVTVGEHVRAGQMLAQLDTTPFLSQEQQAAAQLASARANYDKAVAQTQGSSTQLEVAQAQLRRQQELLKLGISSQSDVDIARAAVASARAQLGVSGENQQARPDIEVAQAAIQQAQAALTAAMQNVAYASLVAPFSGVVTARLHNDGETVDPTSPVLQIAKDSSVVFTAEFAPRDATRIHVGDRATVQAQSNSQRTTGSVIAINPSQSNAARSVDVLIGLSRGGLTFGPGAYGTASIRVGSARGLVVPESAIVSDPTTGSSQVFKKIANQYSPVPVSVKLTFNNRAWVQSDDLHPGDVVAGRGAAQLSAPAQQQPADTD
jgi:HlyD family secretion protein